MNVLYILVPIALALAGLGAIAFRWAVNNGQYDDLESPAVRILIDDELDSTRQTKLASDSSVVATNSID